MGSGLSYQSPPRYFYDPTKGEYQVHQDVVDDWGKKTTNIYHYPHGPPPPPHYFNPKLVPGYPGSIPLYPGQPLPGQPLPGQPLLGQPLPGQPLPGQPLPGQPLPGQLLPGQPLPGQLFTQLPPGPIPVQTQSGKSLPGQSLSGNTLPVRPLSLSGNVLPGQYLPGNVLPGQQTQLSETNQLPELMTITKPLQQQLSPQQPQPQQQSTQPPMTVPIFPQPPHYLIVVPQIINSGTHQQQPVPTVAPPLGMTQPSSSAVPPMIPAVASAVIPVEPSKTDLESIVVENLVMEEQKQKDTNEQVPASLPTSDETKHNTAIVQKEGKSSGIIFSGKLFNSSKPKAKGFDAYDDL